MTLLFTDIVGSTALKQRWGDRVAADLLQAHNAVIRELLGQTRDAIGIRTIGDSFFLAFAQPSKAVRSALLLQSRLRAFNRSQPSPVEDRIGIHLGEVVIEDDAAAQRTADLVGIHVDACARVTSLARGGQVLMTRAVFDNAR